MERPPAGRPNRAHSPTPSAWMAERANHFPSLLPLRPTVHPGLFRLHLRCARCLRAHSLPRPNPAEQSRTITVAAAAAMPNAAVCHFASGRSFGRSRSLGLTGRASVPHTHILLFPLSPSFLPKFGSGGRAIEAQCGATRRRPSCARDVTKNVSVVVVSGSRPSEKRGRKGGKGNSLDGPHTNGGLQQPLPGPNPEGGRFSPGLQPSAKQASTETEGEGMGAM